MNNFLQRARWWAIGAVIVALLVAIVWGAIDRASNQAELARLRNEAASKDQTIEIQKGVYSKLSLETEDLRKLLKSKDEQVESLLGQVRKNREDLLAANQLVLKWKRAYEGAVDSANQSTPDTTHPERLRVDFAKDFGYIGVKGWTLVNPPEAWVSVKQLKPLKVTVAVSQDAHQQWHAYATSSDDNTEVEIALAAVNPHILEPKWYENIGLGMTLAGGTTPGGFGALVGVDATYKIQHFELGPAVFVGIGKTFPVYFGATFQWRPFEK